MVPRGLEPRTLWLLAVRSNQLSYETTVHIHTYRCQFCIVKLIDPRKKAEQQLLSEAFKHELPLISVLRFVRKHARAYVCVCVNAKRDE